MSPCGNWAQGNKYSKCCYSGDHHRWGWSSVTPSEYIAVTGKCKITWGWLITWALGSPFSTVSLTTKGVRTTCDLVSCQCRRLRGFQLYLKLILILWHWYIRRRAKQKLLETQTQMGQYLSYSFGTPGSFIWSHRISHLLLSPNEV